MKHDYNLDELEQINVRDFTFNIMPRYKYHYVDNDYENFSLDLLELLVEDGGTAIDIGAHYGVYSLLAAQKSKKVYAFEPVPENFKILQKNIKDNGLTDKITAVNKAVSDKDGSVDFNVTWASDSAGFYNHPNAEVIKKIKVKMTSIDSQLKAVKDVSFIKIDTEGHELHVLDGIKGTLKRNKKAKLLIEYNPECLENAGASSAALLEKIEKLGYDIFALHEKERYICRVTKDTPEQEVLRGGTYLNLLCLPKGSWDNMVFISHNAGLGGAELVLHETILGLIHNKDKFIMPLVVLPGEGPLTEKFKKLPIATVTVPSGWWVRVGEAEDRAKKEELKLLNADAVTEITKVCREFQPRVVVTNTMVSPWGAIVARTLGIPHVWSIHEFGELDHGFTFEYGYKESLEFIDEMSARVVVNSKAVAKHVGKYINSKKITTLYPVTNQTNVNPLKDDIFGKDASLKLVVAGRISPTKGQLDAVKAVSELRANGHKAELMLVGDRGPSDYVAEIEAYITKCKLEKFIHIVGFKDDPHSYMQAADIFVMPSANEAFGRVTFEAMLLGLPIIGADSGATKELVKSGDNGYLFKPGDVDSLVKNIEKIVKADSAKAMGEQSRKMAGKLIVGNYSKELYRVTTDTTAKDFTMRALYSDLLEGVSLSHDRQLQTQNDLQEAANAELQKFSDEYNKVYRAYEDIEERLNAINRSKVIRLRNKVKKLRTKRKA